LSKRKRREFTFGRGPHLPFSNNKFISRITEYGLNISVQTTKSMAFKGRDLVRAKFVIETIIMEEVDFF